MEQRRKKEGKKERRKSWIQQKGVSVKQTIPCYTLNMVINYIKILHFRHRGIEAKDRIVC